MLKKPGGLPKQLSPRELTPLEALNQGFVLGVNAVGEGFSRGGPFPPRTRNGWRSDESGGGCPGTRLARRGAQRIMLGRVVIGTVEDDIHDIGKTLVSTMLSASGFEVHDLGSDVPLEKLLEKACAVNADIVGLSAMLTTHHGQPEAFH